MQKKVQCPRCKIIITIDGISGETKELLCPACQLKGQVSFRQEIADKNSAINVMNLRKEYGSLVAVNNISFSVNKGEVFAFLGPNGAGKTTTVEIIESIRKPTSGNVKIIGKDIKTSFNQVKDIIGILPQEFKSFERLTVRETLDYYSKLYKKRADIDEILSAMDLKYCEDKFYKDLSGGMKQRVGVAIALVNDPEIVFLDEPTTGLDPKARREVWEVIANLRNKGKTIFLTTHYMEEAEYLADYICIIHKGKIIAEGTIHELIERYGSSSILHIRGCKDSNAEKMLQENGFNVLSKNNSNLSIQLKYNDQLFEILSALRHECVDYESIDVKRSNLEEVFLNLTGSKLTEET